jgi:hypothetical protein
LTLTAVVELDVAVDVESIVDLHVDHRSRLFDEDSQTIRRSTYKVAIIDRRRDRLPDPVPRSTAGGHVSSRHASFGSGPE